MDISELNIYYNKFIADAAREYMSANINHRLERTEETRKKESNAFSKLDWMIHAQKFNWNPKEYITEN